MTDPVTIPAAVKGFVQGVRFFRGLISSDFVPLRERSIEEQIRLTRLPAAAGRVVVAADFPAGRRPARTIPQSSARGGVTSPRPAPDVPQAEPIRPSPPAGEPATVPPTEVITDAPTSIFNPSTIAGARAAATAAARVAARIKAAREAARQRKQLDEALKRATEAAKRAERVKQSREAGRGVIRREDAAKRSADDRAKILREMGKTQRRAGGEFRNFPDPVQGIDGPLERRQAQQEIIKRQSPRQATKAPSRTPLWPFLAGVAVISAPALIGRTRQGGRTVPSSRTTTNRQPKIGFTPSDAFRPPRNAPSPPFTDPLTPTDPIIGTTTLTSTQRFSRTRQRTKECQEVLRRRRRKGQCKEGFFEELPGRTRFTTWRTYDCKTGKTVKRTK